jgi:hypothetical protein
MSSTAYMELVSPLFSSPSAYNSKPYCLPACGRHRRRKSAVGEIATKTAKTMTAQTRIARCSAVNQKLILLVCCSKGTF